MTNSQPVGRRIPARLRGLNQALRTGGERWRPIACSDVSPLRRFFDLQAGTVWHDLSKVLPHVRGRLVDVGCGAQPYRGLLSDGVQYMGLDTFDARTAFGYDVPETRQYDGVTWPLEAESVDVVLSTETLEHVPDPVRFLGEAQRVLAPGGELILTVPFCARWHFIPRDYWRFTPAGLQRLLDAAGFGEIQIFARGNSLTVAAYKCLTVLTPFILPSSPSRLRSIAARVAGLIFAPLFVSLAVCGNLSLLAGTDDDCLGYTVFARKRPATLSS